MIDHLAVIEAHRRTGIGKKLIAFILGKAKELKARFVSVQTATWNTDSIAFYESLGFKKRAVFPEYLGEKNDMIWLDIDLRISNRGQS
jgi:ribosomal protein S18 acetylase RimI-like enzyme